jgi:hypothetical protein
LKNSDLAECGSSGDYGSSSAKDKGKRQLVDSHLPWISAVQLVLDVRNEQRLHKPLEQTESMVKEKDRNSMFFHLSTLIRRRINFIAGIQLANGNWIHSRKDIEGYFASEFQSIFQSSHPQIPPLLEGLVSPAFQT